MIINHLLLHAPVVSGLVSTIQNLSQFVTEGTLPANSEAIGEFSFFKSVPILSYTWSRRRRIISGLGTRTGSTLFFSTTARFCDIKNDETAHFRLLVRLQQLVKRSDRQESGVRVFNCIHSLGHIVHRKMGKMQQCIFLIIFHEWYIMVSCRLHV